MNNITKTEILLKKKKKKKVIKFLIVLILKTNIIYKKYETIS